MNVKRLLTSYNTLRIYYRVQMLAKISCQCFQEAAPAIWYLAVLEPLPLSTMQLDLYCYHIKSVLFD